MASRTHLVTKYQYSFDARAGGPGGLRLWSDLGRIVEIGFVGETSPVPDPVIAADLTSATVWFRRSALRGLIDLLRTQKPVRVTLDDQGHVDILKSHGLADRPVHEAMHAWFVGRQQTYRIQEPFCKLVSFIISEEPGGPDYCNWFSSTPDSHPDVLMKYLCQIGMTTELAAEVLAQTAHSAAVKGEPLTDAEFADVVTAVLGQNAVPAFVSAGILP